MRERRQAGAVQVAHGVGQLELLGKVFELGSESARAGPRASILVADGHDDSRLQKTTTQLGLATARVQMSNAQRSSFSKRWFREARARLQKLSVRHSGSAVQRLMRSTIARAEEKLRSDLRPHSHKRIHEKRIREVRTQLEVFRLKSEELARRAATLNGEQTARCSKLTYRCEN